MSLCVSTMWRLRTPLNYALRSHISSVDRTATVLRKSNNACRTALPRVAGRQCFDDDSHHLHNDSSIHWGSSDHIWEQSLCFNVARVQNQTYWWWAEQNMEHRATRKWLNEASFTRFFVLFCFLTASGWVSGEIKTDAFYLQPVSQLLKHGAVCEAAGSNCVEIIQCGYWPAWVAENRGICS